MSNDNLINDYLHKLRHSAEHVLTMAMLRLYPRIKAAMGPATEDGFYFDFEFEGKISEEDFPKIEKEMAKIIKENLPISKDEMSVEEARVFFSKNIYKDNEYKHEWLDEIEGRKEGVSIYWMGEKNKDMPETFVDICSGPHVESTGAIKAFKLLSVAGAYWRGDEKNKMLTRIYGTAFESQKELDEYLHMREEAEKRDHRKLGKELDLFTFSDLVGGGLPLWTPKGTLLRNLLDDFIWQLRKERGYSRVEIPHITRKDLYETSGHWEKFKDELFRITTREGHEFAMKPMNCPHHTQIYARKKWSYRELPQRYANTTMCYRDEQSGELHGLSRVRSITQDDAHVFCRFENVKEEMLNIWDIVDIFYPAFGYKLDVRLSLHDPNEKEKYLGGEDIWEKAESLIRELVLERGVTATEAQGEAAFYGPKIDFIARDSIGREWQVATIQLDMNMPERFNLTCVNEKGENERIVMIHAAIMGSIERFLSTTIEHLAGNFPLWLSPVQVHLLPVSNEKHAAYAHELQKEFAKQGIRAEVDDADETVGNKIRKAAQQKTPYILVVGDKEKESGNLMVRKRGQEEQFEMNKEVFIEQIVKEIKEKAINE